MAVKAVEIYARNEDGELVPLVLRNDADRLGPELVENGNFEEVALVWEAFDGDETVSIDAVSPTNFGTHSLKIETNGTADEEGALTDSSFAVEPDGTVRFRMLVRGTGTIKVKLNFGSGEILFWPVTLTSEFVRISADVPVPSFSSTCNIAVVTASEQETIIWIDDVSLRVVNF